MKRKRPSLVNPTLADTTLSELFQADQELAGLRREYASQSRQKRRKAADWQYESACAADLFDQALGTRGAMGDALGSWRGYAAALAIDPEHGPALLTAGAIEYQLGRVDEGMGLLLQLPRLAHEEDLPEIIDKAGDFLIDQDDFANAETLFAAAAEAHPEVAIYHDALSYCAGKSDRFDEAVTHARRAVELEPDNHVYLTDLGYSLIQAGQYDEAERVLRRAVELAPPDYDLAKGNLAHLYDVRD
jgi:Flp pilus assembly protein TadD